MRTPTPSDRLLRLGLALLPILLFGLIPLPCRATDGSQVPAMLPDLKLNRGGVVWCLKRQPDGSIIVGGEFNEINGKPRSNLARILADGSTDPEWAPDADAPVYALSLGAGHVFVGGAFTQIGGERQPYLAKLSLSGKGQASTEWTPRISGGEVRAILANGDELFIGGYFNRVNERFRHKIAKVLTIGSGELDEAWNPSADGGGVVSMALDGQQLYVGGWFNRIGGLGRHKIARLSAYGSGSADPDWNPSASAEVYSIVVTKDAVYVAGSFKEIGGERCAHLARLSKEGSGYADSSWRPDANDRVYKLLLSGNSLYAAGWFTEIGGSQQPYLAKLSLSGAPVLDASWKPLFSGAVLAVEEADGLLFTGGTFTQIGNYNAVGIAALDPVSGLIDSKLKASIHRPGIVYAIAQPADGSIIVGGDFLEVDRNPHMHLARILPNGKCDPKWNLHADGEVFAMTARGDQLFIGGAFSRIGKTDRGALAKISIEKQQVDPKWNPGANNSVYALVGHGHYLFAGGWFTMVGGTDRPYLAKLSAEGSGQVDRLWNPKPDAVVVALAANERSLFAGGSFDSIGGFARKRVAKLEIDGAGQADPQWAPNADGVVVAMALGKEYLYAGGFFKSIGNRVRHHLAKIAIDGPGVVEPQWDPRPNEKVWSLQLVGEDLYAGGYFTRIGNHQRNYIAKLDPHGHGDVDPLWRMEANDKIWTLSATQRRLCAGGSFTEIDGQGQTGFALLDMTTFSPPIITSNKKALALVDRPFKFSVQATGYPTSFSVHNLPPGLKVDPETGIISGSPGNTGLFSSKTSATNKWGAGVGDLDIVVLTPLEDWRNRYFKTPENLGPAANSSDPDGDGIPNLVEFALMLDPTQADRAGLPVSRVVTDASDRKNYLEISYRRRKGGTRLNGLDYAADGVLYRVEISTSDATDSWVADPALMHSSRKPIDIKEGEDIEIATIRSVPPIYRNAPLYFRLRVLPTDVHPKLESAPQEKVASEQKGNPREPLDL